MSTKEKETAHMALSMSSLRGEKQSLKSQPRKAVDLGFVDLISPGHSRPQPDTDYNIIPASVDLIGTLPAPSTATKRLDIDLYEFYSADLPDIWGSNEGLVKIDIDTKQPQDINGEEKLATFATNFSVGDGEYAPSFTYRGVFRNVLIGDWANLGFDLYELDEDSIVYYEKVKSVIDNVPEVKNIDVLKGVPYLDVATKLFDGIIRTFGKNPDDHIWGEIPILETDPIIGGAFLRSGIYIVYERTSNASFDDLVYRNGRVGPKAGATLNNHLIMGVRVKGYVPN